MEWFLGENRFPTSVQAGFGSGSLHSAILKRTTA